jgi:hypothetical protein
MSSQGKPREEGLPLVVPRYVCAAARLRNRKSEYLDWHTLSHARDAETILFTTENTPRGRTREEMRAERVPLERDATRNLRCKEQLFEEGDFPLSMLRESITLGSLYSPLYSQSLARGSANAFSVSHAMAARSLTLHANAARVSYSSARQTILEYRAISPAPSHR